MITYIIIISAVCCILFLLYNRLYQQKKYFKTKLDKQIEDKSKQLKEITIRRTNQLIALEKEQQELISLSKEIQLKKQNIASFYEKMENELNLKYIQVKQTYVNKEKQLKNQICQIQTQKDQAQNKLFQVMYAIEKVTKSYEKEQDQDNLKQYKIQLTDNQITDIENLQLWKRKLFNPTVVSKIIWSSYIINPTTDLCNRILKDNPTCGIYKITNLITHQMYIGQSVNVADRIKSHIKCGLGIDASSTNKLYNNMQRTGVWNFSYELLQKCSREQLNERQRFWIDTYKSNKTGLNVTKGITK